MKINCFFHLLGPPYSEQDLKLGHVILVYVSCCLAGRAYPVGEIDEDSRVKVKHLVLTSLTCLHSKRALDDEPPYPYLRTLLEFNTQELLNALSLAFEESEFDGEMGARRQQRVIDILVEIMINSSPFSVSILDLVKSVFLELKRKNNTCSFVAGSNLLFVYFHCTTNKSFSSPRFNPLGSQPFSTAGGFGLFAIIKRDSDSEQIRRKTTSTSSTSSS